MAIKLVSKPNTAPVSGTYPYGNIKDDDGTGNGTPVNVLTNADFHQFFSKLMDAAGIVANDTPDNLTNGFQLYQALSMFTADLYTKIVNIGAWNMNTTAIKNVPHGLGAGFIKIREVSVMIIDDTSASLSPLNRWDSRGLTAMNMSGGVFNIDGTNVGLDADTNGQYQNNAAYTVAANRGWVIIRYTK
jgi:hypothetical protein